MAATALDPQISPSLLMVDNYDSFTFNLVQHLEELGASVIVSRNDRLTLDGIRSLALLHNFVRACGAQPALPHGHARP